jgi:DNA-directed RNA polymerase subunit H (RpoH/RPB5)
MSAQRIHLYFGARQTCLEMMNDRRYRIPSELYQLTEDDFSFYKTGDSLMRGIYDTTDHEVIVLLTQESSKDAIIKLISDYSDEATNEEELKKLTSHHFIIICDITNKLTQFVTNFIGHPFVEIFDVRQMFINPTKHIYQPKWRLMKDDEITEMLQRYEAKSVQTSRVLLGSVCLDDPVNRYYGGRPASKDRKGDVYEITREGVTVFYRKVISKRINVKPDRKTK